MDQKFCRLCQTKKDISDFSWKFKKTGRRQSYCRVCQNIRSKKHYQEYKEKYIEKARKRNKQILAQIQSYVWKYLSAHSCIDCGESDIVVLEFDHTRDKQYNLFEIVKERGSLIKVKKEIKKCVVRCANCHRRKTAKDFGWKKANLPR